jgi:hypothetical protein
MERRWPQGVHRLRWQALPEVCDELDFGRLAKRRLLTVARENITPVPGYTVLRPWRRR